MGGGPIVVGHRGSQGDGEGSRERPYGSEGGSHSLGMKGGGGWGGPTVLGLGPEVPGGPTAILGGGPRIPPHPHPPPAGPALLRLRLHGRLHLRDGDKGERWGGRGGRVGVGGVRGGLRGGGGSGPPLPSPLPPHPFPPPPPRWWIWGWSFTKVPISATCGTFWTSLWSAERWWPSPSRESRWYRGGVPVPPPHPPLLPIPPPPTQRSVSPRFAVRPPCCVVRHHFGVPIGGGGVGGWRP